MCVIAVKENNGFVLERMRQARRMNHPITRPMNEKRKKWMGIQRREGKISPAWDMGLGVGFTCDFAID